ncbi:MAG: hypothetical protein AMS21_06465 [Gemmatimonas sp. SG8_38_2]|nr:MAG: hypothetical protein AMS21_06465 [Gemmatimonas sp. SG8_38_2]
MGKINVGRVILGGLVAGLVINIGESILNLAIAGETMELAYRQLNLEPPGGTTIGMFIILGFVLGILLVWLYAALRPRFGASAKTAIMAGFFVWLFAFLWPSIGNGLIGLFDADLLVFGIVWGLFEVLAASVAGAWVYRED